MPGKKNFQVNEIYDKAKRYCAYQERAVSDVVNKLRLWKVKQDTADRVIQALTDEEFLDDERYARVFASGKFRIKKWGKLKIRAELRSKRISDAIIQKALDEIDDAEYILVLQNTIAKKQVSLPEPKSPSGRNKVLNHALSRGFEQHLILRMLD